MARLMARNRGPHRRLMAPNEDSMRLRRAYLAYQDWGSDCSAPTICWNAVRVSGPSGLGGAAFVFFRGRMYGVAPAQRAANALALLR